MELSKTFSKIKGSLLPFEDFLYILQLEEYSSKRMLKWLPRFYFRRNFQTREHLIFTKRAKITLVLVTSMWIASLAAVVLSQTRAIIAISALILWLLAIPLFVLVGNALLSPYFEVVKSRIRNKAETKVKNLPSLKIVVVAGSYGKTTVKNFISQLARYNYRTQMIPGNINTPSGIASWIIQHLQSNTELLIAEVDAYEIGEIAKSCKIIPADIAILTNIGDQHLERFGNELHLGKALMEVFTISKPNAVRITTKETISKISNSVQGLGKIDVVEVEYNDSVDLSETNKVNLQLSLEAVRKLNIPAKFILDTIPKLELPDRRQKVTEMYGYEAVDDSYNISFTTAKAAVKAGKELSLKLKKKLLVITAGIPELSRENISKNKELGEILDVNADHIIVLGSMFAHEVISGINQDSKFTLLKDLHTFINQEKRKYSPHEWCLLVQPELGDLYY